VANPDPYKARLARKGRRKVCDLAALQRKVWGAICDAEELRTDAPTAELRLKAIYALSQAAMVFIKVHEVGELEQRLTALEQAMNEEK
jgi:hypothetical protein